VTESLPLWLVGASLTLNALFLRRLLGKVDTLYDAIVGTATAPGLRDRLYALELRVDAIEGEKEKARWFSAGLGEAKGG
jgi:hypothetical protein